MPIGVGFGLVLDPDPGASKAFGIYLIVKNLDGFQANIRTAASGQSTPTILHQSVKEALVGLGVDESEADRGAAVVELGSNIVEGYKLAVIPAAGAGLGGEVEVVAPNTGMRSPRYGKYVSRVDDYKHALDPAHVQAAKIEKGGGIVKLKADGTPFDHLGETRLAMSGAKERIIQLKKYLSDPGLSAEMQSAVQAELGELSQMLDNAESLLGELAQ